MHIAANRHAISLVGFMSLFSLLILLLWGRTATARGEGGELATLRSGKARKLKAGPRAKKHKNSMHYV
jgi:hypothetical protein